MKLYMIILVTIFFSLGLNDIGAQPPVNNNEGVEWIATITKHSNRCNSIGRDFPGTHHFIVTVNSGGKRVVINKKTGIAYNGRVDKDNPMIILYWASYLEDAGVLTEKIIFRKTDDANGSGHSVWYWSDGLMNCGGEYSFTAARAKKNKIQ